MNIFIEDLLRLVGFTEDFIGIFSHHDFEVCFDTNADAVRAYNEDSTLGYILADSDELALIDFVSSFTTPDHRTDAPF